MKTPSNTTQGVGGGTIRPSRGNSGKFTVATGNKSKLSTSAGKEQFMTPHFTCSNTKLIVDKEMKKAFDEALAFLLQNSIHTTQKMKAGKKPSKFPH